MGDENDNVLFDYDQARIMAMYADGCSVAEIGAAYHRSVHWVYQQMAQFPDRKEEAKARRQLVRTGKYRRIASLSQDFQINTMEKFLDLLSREDDLREELAAIEEKAMKENWERVKSEYSNACNNASKTKELNPAPIEELMAVWRQEARRQRIEEQLDQINLIQSKIKDISLIGAAAEKQADLDDGKPTVRVDNQGVQIVTFGELSKAEEGS